MHQVTSLHIQPLAGTFYILPGTWLLFLVRAFEDQLFYDITNLYYNAQILKQQVKFLDANLINSNILLKNIQLLHEQLLAKNSDVSKVQLQVSQLAIAKINIVNKYEQVLNMLKFSIGISLDRFIEIDTAILFQSINDISYSNSADIKLAKKQFELLNNELTTLKYSKLPTLALYGTYGTTGFGYNVKPNDFLKFFPICSAMCLVYVFRRSSVFRS